ncbi:MAG: hypothetical protein HOA01_05285 [Flavobacteriales bacterium]|nr:hypothetical protein [Flavobacteriales bacterium]
MNIKQLFVFLAVVLLLSSCFNNNEGRIIASVNEKDLMLEEVLEEMPIQIEDSSFFVERYMNDWIRKQLMIYHAEINLSSAIQNYEKQIKEYRASLLIYAYQQELINQNFDTSISLKQVTDYYNQYKDEFKLSKNIFKGRFIVVDRSAPKLINLNKWYKSDTESSLEDLNDYCQQFAKEYYLEDDKWQYFSIFNQKLPEYIIEESYFLENTKGVVFEDVNLRYYVFIKDYLINGSISPLEMEQEKIKNVLLNKNKIEYLKQLEDELYQNGLALKKIKIY